jgi:hypothetical protein
MGRVYSAAFTFDKPSSVSDASHFIEITAASGKAVRIHLVEVTSKQMTPAQSGGSGGFDFIGGVAVYAHYGTTPGSGGTTVTPAPWLEGDTAFGGTVRYLPTSLATGLTAVLYNTVTGGLFYPGMLIVVPSGDALVISPGHAFVLRVELADPFNGGILSAIFEEWG